MTLTTPPAQAPDDVRASALAPAEPVPTPGARTGSSSLVWGVIGIVIASLLGALVFVYLISGLGTGAFVFAGILALVPLVIVFFGIRWIDRWEPEPRGPLLFAFLWGSGVSVLIALLVGAEIDNVINSLGGPGPGYEFFTAAIQAPVVEEAAKGLGVLLIFFFARKHFDGPVDGIVYAATVAGGFAFTENILYFGQAIIESGGRTFDIAAIFLLRGLMSPFAHVMFTACLGVFLGIAARRGARVPFGWFVLGLVPAILLHAIWNGSLFFVSDFFGYYAIVQVPLFVLAVVLVLYLRRQELKLVRERLSDYVEAGWYAPAEVGALATPGGRRVALAWARRTDRGGIMRRYIQQTTRLTFARQRIITGTGRAGAVADEARLLEEILATRQQLRG